MKGLDLNYSIVPDNKKTKERWKCKIKIRFLL